MKFRSITWLDLGITLDARDDWLELGPYLRNSDLEFDKRVPVGRFVSFDSQEHMIGSLFISWMPNGANQTPTEVAREEQGHFQSNHFEHFALSESTLSGKRTSLLECDFQYPDRLWSLRNYYFQSADKMFALAFDSRDIAEDGPIFDHIVNSFKFIDKAEEALLSQMALLYYSDDSRSVLRAAQDVMHRCGDTTLRPKHVINSLTNFEDESVKENLHDLGVKSDVTFNDDAPISDDPAFVGNDMFHVLTETIPSLAKGIVKPIHILAGFLPATDIDTKSAADRPPPEPIKHRFARVEHLKACYNVDKNYLRLGLFEAGPKLSWVGEEISISLSLLDEPKEFDITENVVAVYECNVPT